MAVPVFAQLGAMDAMEMDAREWDGFEAIREEIEEKFGLPHSPLPRPAFPEVTDQLRFQLFNSCKPLATNVGFNTAWVPSDGKVIEMPFPLTEEEIQVTVESRLRSARLYDAGEDADAELNVVVSVVNSDFKASLAYSRYLQNSAGFSDWMKTWWIEREATHGNYSSGYILSKVSKLSDTFVAEYLRVNESACPSPKRSGAP